MGPSLTSASPPAYLDRPGGATATTSAVTVRWWTPRRGRLDRPRPARGGRDGARSRSLPRNRKASTSRARPSCGSSRQCISCALSRGVFTARAPVARTGTRGSQAVRAPPVGRSVKRELHVVTPEISAEKVPSDPRSAGMKVHAIQTGTVAVKSRQREGKGRGPARLASTLIDRTWTQPLPIFAWLIEHPEGLIVVDTVRLPASPTLATSRGGSRTSSSVYASGWRPKTRSARRSGRSGSRQMTFGG